MFVSGSDISKHEVFRVFMPGNKYKISAPKRFVDFNIAHKLFRGSVSLNSIKNESTMWTTNLLDHKEVSFESTGYTNPCYQLRNTGIYSMDNKKCANISPVCLASSNKLDLESDFVCHRVHPDTLCQSIEDFSGTLDEKWTTPGNSDEPM
ncbi:hypothetical protein KSP40_PGU019290 [Platanthera guangdongensis]|uniref:Uncharacterized protein n=1 Tax=Platanthera guangdongensis TaxID=2320717 RepID=A0ABR2LLT8_9ASPA